MEEMTLMLFAMPVLMRFAMGARIPQLSGITPIATPQSTPHLSQQGIVQG